MAKVHITLVGGQPEPVYNGIMYNEPDKVLFIYSDQSTKLEMIENMVKKNSARRETEFYREKFNAQKVQKISSRLKKLFENGNDYFTKDDDVTINLTGGTKAWSILFFDYFKGFKNISFHLVDQNNNMYDITNDKTIKIKVLGIADTFSLHGIKIKENSALDDYTEADFNAINTIHEMRKYNYEHFRELTKELSSQTNKSEANYKRSSIKYNKSSNKDRRNIVFQLEGYSGIKSWTVTSPNIRKLIINTGWFEVEVARLLHEVYPETQMLLNCKLKFASDKTIKEKNEIDIVMKINDKLLFVECKTNVYDITDVNKFNEVAEIAGGKACKRIFFTLDKMVDAAQENCDERHILRLLSSDTKDEIKKKIDEYLAISNA